MIAYAREHALQLVLVILVAAVLVVTISHRSSTATGEGAKTPPVCSMDGNFNNDAPGCVPPRKP